MRHRTTIAILLGMALVVSACGETTNAPTGDGGLSEGIGVHGAWTIDVFNADGSRDQTLSFENALTEGGAAALVNAVLNEEDSGAENRGYVTDVIVLADAGGLDFEGTSPCDDPYNESGFEPINSAPFVTTACFVDGVIAADGGSPAFTVSGSATAERDGTIDTVETWMVNSGSGAIWAIALTRAKGDPLPIDVLAGQTIDVSVEISFDTGSLTSP